MTLETTVCFLFLTNSRCQVDVSFNHDHHLYLILTFVVFGHKHYQTIAVEDQKTVSLLTVLEVTNKRCGLLGSKHFFCRRKSQNYLLLVQLSVTKKLKIFKRRTKSLVLLYKNTIQVILAGGNTKKV